MKISVKCYSGHKADQRPVKFHFSDRILFVESIEEQWYGPGTSYFRVRADDENTYVLAYSEANDEWTLDSSRLPAP